MFNWENGIIQQIKSLDESTRLQYIDVDLQFDEQDKTVTIIFNKAISIPFTKGLIDMYSTLYNMESLSNHKEVPYIEDMIYITSEKVSLTTLYIVSEFLHRKINELIKLLANI